MKVRLRRVAYWAGAAAVGLIVACYAILSSLTFEDLVKLLQDEVKLATGRELTVAGPVDLEISLSPSIDLQDVRFANAPWGSRPDMVTIRRLEVEVDLLPLLVGDIIVNRLILESPDILLETDEAGTGNWEVEAVDADSGEGSAGAEDEGSEDIVLPDVQAFSVQGGLLTIKGADPEQVLRVDLTEASGLVPEGDGRRSLTLRGRYNDSPFDIAGTFGSLRDILSGQVTPLDITAKAGNVEVRLEGAAGDLVGAAKAELAITAKGESLAGLSPLVGAALPPLGPFELSLDAEMEQEKIGFSGLSLQLAGSDLSGAGSLDLSASPPFLAADLVAKNLNLDDLQAPDEGSATQGQDSGSPAGSDASQKGQASEGGRLFSKAPLGLEVLSALDGKISLSAAAVQLSSRLTVSEVDVTAQLRGGDLRVEPVSGQLAGGALRGRGGVALIEDGEEGAAALEVDLKGEGIDFDRLLKEADVSDEVRGEVDLEAVLSSQGGSLHGWASNLNGHVQAVSRDGTIDNALLGVLSAGISNITGPLFGSSNTANVNCIVGRFDIADGDAESRALVLDTGSFAVTGRGSIDLAAERVDLAFDTETSEPSLASLAVPFLVVGPIENPNVVPDPIGTAGNIVGTVGTVAEAGGNMAAKLVNTLSGLVGSGPLVGQIGSGKTLCEEALAAIDEAPAPAVEKKPAAQQKPAQKSVVDKAKDAAEEAGRSIEKGLKSLFGD